jgi:hypothetical protein
MYSGAPSSALVGSAKSERAFGLASAAAIAIVTTLFALPVFLTETLPLFDYYNHLARAHIILSTGTSEILNRFYEIRWRPVPNLALDLIIPMLARAMPLEWAGKCFVVLIMGLAMLGTTMLHRTLFKRPSIWPCVAALFLYSRVLLWGLLNALFAMSLCLIGFAIWLHERERRPALAIALGSVVSILLYFSHLLGFGAYGLLVVSYEMGDLVAGRRLLSTHAVKRLALVSIQFILPATLFLFSGAVSAGRLAFNIGRKFDLFFTVFNNYDIILDGASFALLVALFAVGIWRAWIEIDARMKVPLAAILLVHFLLPTSILTAQAVDKRLPVLFAFVLVASTLPRLPHVAGRVWLAVAMACLLTGRLASVWTYWRASDETYRSYRETFDQLPIGARLAVAYPDEMVNIFRDTPPLVNLPGLAVIRRDAFVPTLFAQVTQQPLQFTPAFRATADAATPSEIWRALMNAGTAQAQVIQQTLCSYDFVLFVHRADFIVPQNSQLIPVERKHHLQLFRVRRCRQ